MLRRVAFASLQLTTLLGLAMIGLIWGGVVFDLHDEATTAHAAALQTTGNLVRAFEEHTIRVLKELDRSILLARARYLRDPAHFDLVAFAQSPMYGAGAGTRMGFIGPDGLLKMNSSGPIFGRVDLSDREHFRTLRDAQDDMLFISRPIRYRTSGSWAIQVARAVRDKDGRFLGVIGAVLDPLRLSSFYESIDLGDDGAIALVGLDGIVRAGAGFRHGMIGRSLSGSSLFARLADAPAGAFTTDGASDGVRRLVSYRVVRGYPLALYVGRSEAGVYADTLRNQHFYVVLASGLTVLVLIAIALGVRQRLSLDSAHTSLAASEARATAKSHALEVTLDHMNQGIMMIDRGQNIAVINRRLIELLDLPERFLDQRPQHHELLELLWQRQEFGRDGELLEPHVRAYLTSNPDKADIGVYERVRPNGIVLEIETASLPNGGLVRTFTDVTERRRSLDHIAQLARQDHLTGLANRALFAERMEQAMARLRRYREWFGVLCIDLDRFKAVNDTYGHAVGDMLLKMVAKRLRQNLRDTDTIARLGGDEFAVLLTPAEQRDEAVGIADRLVEVLGRPYELDNKTAVIGASVGLVLATTAGESAEQLLGKADLALYRAKADGRGRACMFEDAMEADVLARRTLEIELRQALQTEQLVLWYQPIVDLATGTVNGVEALIRWNHPLRGLIGPDRFIAAAEESGLIVPLGEWAIRRACIDALQLPQPIRVAVNLSSEQFCHPGLVEIVRSALEDARLPAERLELEITESVVLEENAVSLSTLNTLRDLGVSIALDDFGTGYSSLSYLRAFPFDKMKIDRSFVSELSQRGDCAAIITAISGLGHSLGLRTTAEGVETPEQAAFVRLAGCSEAQGYLFGRPMPMAEVCARLSDERRLVAPAA